MCSHTLLDCIVRAPDALIATNTSAPSSLLLVPAAGPKKQKIQEASTMTDTTGTRTIATQTNSTGDQNSTLAEIRGLAKRCGHYTTDIHCLRATLRRELQTHLKMPSSVNPSLEVNIPFKAVPLAAWKMLFGSAVQWHERKTKTVYTFTGLITDPKVLNSTKALDLQEIVPYCLDMCKLVFPSSSREARSMLSYAPAFTIWHQTKSDGTMESMISCKMIILDESGETRTPSGAWTDEEETAIKAVMMEQLRLMVDIEWPISEMMEEYLVNWELGQTDGVSSEPTTRMQQLAVGSPSHESNS